MDLTLSPRCATVDGFSLHANVAVHADDRPRLERLARYCARAPIAMDRLERLVDGRLLYRFKRPWRDRTTHIVMEPMELLEKLSALVPAPRAHLLRYSGVLAPASKSRPRIVPEPAILSTIPPDTADATQRSRTDSTATPAATAQQALQPGPCRHGRNYTGRTHEKSMGTGRPRMPSLPGTYENRRSDQLSQRHSNDSQLSGPTVAGAAHRRSRSNVLRSSGMVLKQRRVTLLWASCAHSGHGCHLPGGIGPCSPRSNPSRAAPASRSRRSQRLPATRSTLCLHGSSSVHPLIFHTRLFFLQSLR